MTSRLSFNLVKAAILIVLFALLMLHATFADAQSYKGFTASFGTRASLIASNIPEIDQSRLTQAGGQVGLILGNTIVRSRIGLLGYYSSTGNGAGTTDLYESNGTVNFYPLALLLKRSSIVEPYLTGGLSYDQFKFFGYYINREPGHVNYSHAEAPYVGKLKQVNATLGAGVEVRLRDDYDFVHLFGEVRYGRNVWQKSGTTALGQTDIRDQAHVAIGVSFGVVR